MSERYDRADARGFLDEARKVLTGALKWHNDPTSGEILRSAEMHVEDRYRQLHKKHGYSVKPSSDAVNRAIFALAQAAQGMWSDYKAVHKRGAWPPCTRDTDTKDSLQDILESLE